VRVVSNSSPLISLAKIESFNLLQRLYGSLTISAEVYAEVVVWHTAPGLFRNLQFAMDSGKAG